MRGIELVTLSVLLLSAQQLASGSPAPSQDLVHSLLSGLGDALAPVSHKALSDATEVQLKSGLDAAGCSETSVKNLKLSSSDACKNVLQAAVSYQQFLLNVHSYAKNVIFEFLNYVDYSCFKGDVSIIKKLDCYVNQLDGRAPLFKGFKYLVDDIDTITDLYNYNKKKCLEENSSVKYSVEGEEYMSLESLVEKHCPAGTSVEALKELQ